MTTGEARQSLLDRFDQVPFDQVRDVATAMEILVNVEKKEKESSHPAPGGGGGMGGMY